MHSGTNKKASRLTVSHAGVRATRSRTHWLGAVYLVFAFQIQNIHQINKAIDSVWSFYNEDVNDSFMKAKQLTLHSMLVRNPLYFLCLVF